MIIHISNNAKPAEVARLLEYLDASGCRSYCSNTPASSRIFVPASAEDIDIERLRIEPSVQHVDQSSRPYTLVSREFQNETTVVMVGDVPIGGPETVMIAGPCSVESAGQLLRVAHSVKSSGADLLRGGAYKPRTSPYDFQGLGIPGLQLLRRASDETGLPVVTEVLGTDDVEIVEFYADMLQVGARNMQNFPLLRRLAKSSRPILLKRGLAATIKEWLLAAEYILSGGNPNVVLCERGIRTFESELRNTLDLAGAALAKDLSHLPLIVDPSHATGRRSIIPAMSRAALACGSDGLIIEVHPCPEEALSDGPQSLNLEEFDRLMQVVTRPFRASRKGVLSQPSVEA